VATGNIHEDIPQAQAAARNGSDIIAVIRSTGQSLLDYVPYGATEDGFAGTFATQENFRLMRKALDEVGEELGRYVRLTNYASGLCMPEIASMAATERLDMMLNDCMYGIIFRDINMQRTFVDQHFSRMVHAAAGIIINTGEDNYLTTADAVDAAHTVLASQFLNERLALGAGLKSEQMGLGHAFEIDPSARDQILLEIAHAQLVRECFPEAPLKYMPPTKHMTGNIFQGFLYDGMFNLVGAMTGQDIILLGMMSEGVHTPFLSDRDLAIENARYVFGGAAGLAGDVRFESGGLVERRAGQVLEECRQMLRKVADIGMFAAIEAGMFADTVRTREGGKGLDGVVRRAPDYVNPVDDLLSRELGVA
jgi:beta-lysine 5,6-aminomutase alpha subunit